MKVLKTIVATAVIVFALTTVAMAGAQHVTTQSGQAAGRQAQRAQPTHTAALSAANHTGRTMHHTEAARHHTGSHHADNTTHAGASGSGGDHHHEAAGHNGPHGSATASHHDYASQHPGHHGDGGDCGD